MANSATKDRTARERTTRYGPARGNSAKVGAGDTAKATKQAQGVERRRQVRFPCEGFAEVLVDNAGYLFRGTIQNVSLGGCYIRSSARLALDRGTDVELRFSVNGDHLSAKARAMLVRPNAGAGFEFSAEDAELRSHLLGLIRQIQVAAAAANPRVPAQAPQAAARRSLW